VCWAALSTRGLAFVECVEAEALDYEYDEYVLVDFRLSWGTNEVDCTSSPRFSGRVPRRT